MNPPRRNDCSEIQLQRSTTSIAILSLSMNVTPEKSMAMPVSNSAGNCKPPSRYPTMRRMKQCTLPSLQLRPGALFPTMDSPSEEKEIRSAESRALISPHILLPDASLPMPSKRFKLKPRKPAHREPAGLLNPLPKRPRPSSFVSLDAELVPQVPRLFSGRSMVSDCERSDILEAALLDQIDSHSRKDDLNLPVCKKPTQGWHVSKPRAIRPSMKYSSDTASRPPTKLALSKASAFSSSQ